MDSKKLIQHHMLSYNKKLFNIHNKLRYLLALHSPVLYIETIGHFENVNICVYCIRVFRFILYNPSKK